MKKVAPELESLMWTLAEEGNDRAIDEFGMRHPELRTELLHRISMVKGLRGAKKKTEEPLAAIPRFVPKEPKPRGPGYVVGGLVLAAVCALAFAVTTLLAPPHPRLPDVRPVPNQELVYPKPEVVQKDTAPVVPPVDETNLPHDVVDQGLKPGTLQVKHAPLLAVLELISQTCGVRIDPAPGMPSPEVDVDYRNMNAMEMLRDLGHQYNFTPLDQHDGSILVVPAVDSKESAPQGGMTGEIRDRKIGG